MLGYITARKALEIGMTHHGSYYGIPIWMSLYDPELQITAKWKPLDWLIPVISGCENLIRPLVFPDDAPCFQLKVGEKIK